MVNWHIYIMGYIPHILQKMLDIISKLPFSN